MRNAPNNFPYPKLPQVGSYESRITRYDSLHKKARRMDGLFVEANYMISPIFFMKFQRFFASASASAKSSSASAGAVFRSVV